MRSIFSKKKRAQIRNSTIGSNCIIDDTARVIDSAMHDFSAIHAHSSLVNGTLGLCSYIANNTKLSHIDIGKFCSIAMNVSNRLGNHPTRDFVSTHPAFFSTRKLCGLIFARQQHFPDYGDRVCIGNDVWLGANVILMDGVTIHSGAVVGAGSVVTKDVPPYAIVGGVPAKLIRYRFPQDTIEKLLNFCWWDKDIEWLQKNYTSFQSIDTFISSVTLSSFSNT